MIKLLPAGLPLGITIAGMIIGWYFPQWREIEVFLLFFITPPLLLLFIVLRNPRQRWLPLLFCLLVFSAVRISLRLNPDLPQDHLAHYIHQGRVLLEGVLYRQPEVNEEFTRIYIQSRWVRLPGEKTRVQGRIGAQGRVRVQGRAEMIINSSRPDLHIGDILLMEARLKAPRNYGNPGEYNRAAQSFLKKIYVKGSINEGHFFRIGVEKGYRVQRWLQGLRARLDRFLQAEKDADTRALLKVWLLGNRCEVIEPLQKAFRQTGLAHLLAISGLHVGLVGFFAFWALKTLLKRSQWLLLRISIKKTALLGSLPLLVFYVLIAGSPLTAVRAAAMALLAMGALLLNRPYALWNALMVTALFILISDPAALFSCSFWLSFTAVSGILAARPWWQVFCYDRPASFQNQMIQFYGRLFIISLSALLVTMPLTAFFFNQVTPLGIIPNLVVVPLVGWLVLPCGFITMLGALLDLPGTFLLLKITSLEVQLVIKMVMAFSHIPGINLRLGTPTPLEMVLYYLCFILMVRLPQASLWNKRILALSLAALLLVLTFGRIELARSSYLDITLLSVGQGDSILVEFPGNKRMLIDGGPAIEGRYDAGTRIVAPFLYDRRISRIDYLVASHGQSDHYGGLAAIAEAFRPKALWIGPILGCEAPGYGNFIEGCARKGIVVHQLCRATKPFFINGVKLEVLGPACIPADVFFEKGACFQKINNLSLVMRLTFGTFSILLTGDMEEEAEQELLDTHRDIRADILKVAHHGSRSSTSEAFLNAVRPRAALVSAGFGNHFGFPQDEVIHRLQDRGIRLLRTDIGGAIRIRSDGNNLKIKPFYRKKQAFSPEARLDPSY